MPRNMERIRESSTESEPTSPLRPVPLRNGKWFRKTEIKFTTKLIIFIVVSNLLIMRNSFNSI